jgi:hypothetical protein
MWIFLTDAMLSIVDKGGDGTTLLVRARRQEDISRVFPDARVQVGGGTDYPYRARLDREAVALRLAEMVRGIDYGNFKSAVAEDDRHDAYLRVWSAMHDFQEGERVSRI